MWYDKNILKIHHKGMGTLKKFTQKKYPMDCIYTQAIECILELWKFIKQKNFFLVLILPFWGLYWTYRKVYAPKASPKFDVYHSSNIKSLSLYLSLHSNTLLLFSFSRLPIDVFFFSLWLTQEGARNHTAKKALPMGYWLYP